MAAQPLQNVSHVLPTPPRTPAAIRAVLAANADPQVLAAYEPLWTARIRVRA